MPDDQVALMQQLHDEHAAALWALLPAPDRQRPRPRRGRRAGDAAARLAAPLGARQPAGGRTRLAVHGRPQHRDRRVAQPPLAQRARRRRRARGATSRSTAPTSCCCPGWSPRRSPSSRRSTAPCCCECYYRGRPVAEAARAARRPGGHGEVAHPLRAARAAAGARGDGGERMSCDFARPRRLLRPRGAVAGRAAGSSSSTSPAARTAPARCASWPGCPGCSPGSTRASSRHAGVVDPLPGHPAAGPRARRPTTQRRRAPAGRGRRRRGGGRRRRGRR